MQEHRFFPVLVASGEVTSAPIQLGQFDNAVYQIPSGFEGTTSDLTFLGSTSLNGTYAAMVDSSGTGITATPSHATWQPFGSALFGISYVKIVSNTAQVTNRTIWISGNGAGQ